MTTPLSESPLAWMNAGASPILPFSLIPSSRLPLFERRPLTIRESRYMTLAGSHVPCMNIERRKTVEKCGGGMGVLKHTIHNTRQWGSLQLCFQRLSVRYSEEESRTKRYVLQSQRRRHPLLINPHFALPQLGGLFLAGPEIRLRRDCTLGSISASENVLESV